MLEVAADVAKGGQDFLELGRLRRHLLVLEHLDDLGNPEGSDEDWHHFYAALEVHEPEGVARIDLEGVPADDGEEEAQESRQPALLHGVGTGDAPAYEDAEEGEEEELEGGELEGQAGDDRREDDDEHHAHEGADRRGRGRQAKGPASLAAERHGIAFKGGGRGSGGSRDVEHDRAV